MDSRHSLGESENSEIHQISPDSEALGRRIEMAVHQGLQISIPLRAISVMVFFTFLSEQFGKPMPVMFAVVLGSVLPYSHGRSELMIHHSGAFLKSFFNSFWDAWRKKHSITVYLALFDITIGLLPYLLAYGYALFIAHRMVLNAVWITVFIISAITGFAISALVQPLMAHVSQLVKKP